VHVKLVCVHCEYAAKVLRRDDLSMGAVQERLARLLEEDDDEYVWGGRVRDGIRLKTMATSPTSPTGSIFAMAVRWTTPFTVWYIVDVP
jgi:hypothetical protein